MENPLEKTLISILGESRILSECEIYSSEKLTGWSSDQGVIYEELERLFEAKKILKLVCQTPKDISDLPNSITDLYEQPFYMLANQNKRG